MLIFPELSKNAWVLLIAIAENPSTAAKISKENNLRLNRISEALNELEKFKIIKSRGRRKQLILDSSIRGVLKELLVHYPKESLAELLEGKKLNVLFQVLENHFTIAKLKLITGYSISTLKRILAHLQEKLFVYQPKKGVYKLRDEYKSLIRQFYSVFFSYFLERLENQKITWKEIKVFGNNVLLKSPQNALSGFVNTGFSLFHKYHVPLFLTDDSFFVNYVREPTKEEVFIHALAFSVRDYRYTLYCTLFADLNKLTLKELGHLPKIYEVEKQVIGILEYIKTKGQKIGESLSSYAEYLEVRRDYARD
ncbi:MAG: hypothetical protein Q7S22_00915 [Candidatus Micrarchaeota archaeon]|nr:hypothetical protein [Candidatus Micrarchaeota archaeon]